MLFKTITQFKASFGGIQRTMNWETWKPFIIEAEEFFMIPAIGSELLTELAALVPDDDTAIAGTDKQKALISKLQIACAAYADFAGWFRMIMTTGDAGKTSPSPANMQAPAKWATVGGRKDAMARGDRAVELALQYLEANADDFATWTDSAQYTIDKSLFVSGATELTLMFPHAKNSRRMFMGLKPRILESQKGFLRKLIGSGFITDLLAKKKSGEGSADEKLAIEMISKVVALKAVVEGMPYLNISEDWRLISETDGINNEEVLSGARRDEIMLKESDNLEMAKNELMIFLNATATDAIMPIYFGSVYYTDASSASATSGGFKNDAENKFFVL